MFMRLTVCLWGDLGDSLGEETVFESLMMCTLDCCVIHALSQQTSACHNRKHTGVIDTLITTAFHSGQLVPGAGFVDSDSLV